MVATGAAPGRRLRMGFQVWGQHVTWTELMAAGQAIDELGFESLWSNDHLLPVAGGGSEPLEVAGGPVWDGWMTLAVWAERTRQVTLGCLVSGAAYRNPALLVRMVVALDHASAGRAILGLGAGWHATEHHAFGYAYPSLGQRLDRLEEAAAICRQMLDGQAAELTGTWFSVHGARAEPRPLQPHLPLLIGGSGERRTIPLVARVADIWNGEGEPADWERRSRLLDDACRAVGRDPSEVRRTVGLPPPLIRSDRLEAVEALAAQLTHHGLQPEAARAASQASQLVGDVPQVVARLRAYMAAGVEEVIFDWPSPMDEATLLALAGPVRAALSGGEAGARDDDGS